MINGISILVYNLMKLKEKITQVLNSKNFFIYLIIGTCTFLLDYFLYFVFLNHGVNMNISKASSSFIAVVFNYIFNSRFNFGGKNKMKVLDFLAYILLYGMLILIHVIINRSLYLVINEKHVAVLLSMCISVFINYACVKRFFFYTKNKNYVISNS